MEKRKVLIIVLAFLTVLFTVMPMGTSQFNVEASEAFQKVNSSSGSITAADVNLRTGPAKTFDIICKLKKNQNVTLIGKLGSWYVVYVGSNGNVGAVSSQYVKVSDSKTGTAAKQVAAKAKTDTSTANTKANSKVVSTAAADTIKASADEQALLNMVNKARKDKGLKALEFDSGLVKIARLKAKDMKDNNYFDHTSKLYGTPFEMMKKYNVKFSTAGENIAGNKTVEKAVKAWMNESGNNIYNNKFTHTGIGIVESQTYGKIFVQMFIKK
jgi:uncharacterized YkwD family protein